MQLTSQPAYDFCLIYMLLSGIAICFLAHPPFGGIGNLYSHMLNSLHWTEVPPHIKQRNLANQRPTAKGYFNFRWFGSNPVTHSREYTTTTRATTHISLYHTEKKAVLSGVTQQMLANMHGATFAHVSPFAYPTICGGPCRYHGRQGN